MAVLSRCSSSWMSCRPEALEPAFHLAPEVRTEIEPVPLVPSTLRVKLDGVLELGLAANDLREIGSERGGLEIGFEDVVVGKDDVAPGLGHGDLSSLQVRGLTFRRMRSSISS